MKDIAPELLEKLQEEFKNKVKSSKKLKKLNKLLLDKKATHLESNDFAIEVGEVLSKVFEENIAAENLPDGKMYFNIASRILNPTLKENYNIVSSFTRDVQTELNHNAGLSIQGKIAELNQDRIDGLIDKISKEDDFKQVKWLLNEPVVNFTQSIVDDTIKMNVKFHHDLGLSPKIIRKESGNCCDWCKEIVGTYKYPDEVPEDVYRRHRYCRCTVEYDPGDGKVQNVHTKKWKKDDESLEKFRERQTNNIIRNRKKKDDKLKRVAYDKARELGYNPLPDNKVVGVLRKDSDEWIKKLTENEKKAITKYTHNGVDKDGKKLFEKINGYLEGRYNPVDEAEENLIIRHFNQIRLGLYKNKLKYDIITYRSEENIKYLDGTIKKFLSTSLTQKGSLGETPNVAIIIPKGTNGAYIEKVSRLPNQREFLLNTETDLEKVFGEDGATIYKVVLK